MIQFYANAYAITTSDTFGPHFPRFCATFFVSLDVVFLCWWSLRVANNLSHRGFLGTASAFYLALAPSPLLSLIPKSITPLLFTARYVDCCLQSSYIVSDSAFLPLSPQHILYRHHLSRRSIRSFLEKYRSAIIPFLRFMTNFNFFSLQLSQVYRQHNHYFS